MHELLEHAPARSEGGASARRCASPRRLPGRRKVNPLRSQGGATSAA
jgi:hypothetical protein